MKLSGGTRECWRRKMDQGSRAVHSTHLKKMNYIAKYNIKI